MNKILNFSKFHFRKFSFSKPLYRFFSSSSRELEIENVLNSILHPSGKSITNMGLVKDIKVDNNTVKISIQLTEEYRKIKSLILENISKKLTWVQNCDVKMTSPQGATPQPQSQTGADPVMTGLDNVKNILAVSSCKGGVGKSMVSVNLAYSLSKLNKKVGIFDADIFGPSLPTMVSPPDESLRYNMDNKLIIPPIYENVKTMSYGYVQHGKTGSKFSPAILRGPMVSTLVHQLLNSTDWGELDYLVIDFPPGTGDIPITLCQNMSISAALIVSTPQRLSFVDVVRGIEMFDRVKVPTIGVVENMAYFTCSTCSTKHYPFGSGHRKLLQSQFGMKHSFEIPILPAISKYSDSGRPFVLDDIDETRPIKDVYSNMAKAVVSELAILKDLNKTPNVTYDKNINSIVMKSGKKPLTFNPKKLRLECSCAQCVDEFSGKRLISNTDISDSIYPLSINNFGNYAIAITWSENNHISIYPFDKMELLV